MSVVVKSALIPWFLILASLLGLATQLDSVDVAPPHLLASPARSQIDCNPYWAEEFPPIECPPLADCDTGYLCDIITEVETIEGEDYDFFGCECLDTNALPQDGFDWPCRTGGILIAGSTLIVDCRAIECHPASQASSPYSYGDPVCFCE